VLFVNSGGAVASGLGSLAASIARVWGGNECGTEGVYKGGLAWTRGKRLKRIRREKPGDLPGMCRVCPDLSGRDDMWGPHVSGRERGRRIPFQEGDLAGHGMLLLLGWNLSPRPFLPSLFFSLFFFWFYLKHFCKETLFDSNQVVVL
jgi:hypothetical protein